jgi:DNA-binding ferritin-like protein
MAIPTPPKKMSTMTDRIRTPKEGEFCAYLMSAAVQIHIYHLRVKGPGAYAMHMALNTLYDELPDLVDSLAESIQGKMGLLDYAYEVSYDNNAPNALMYAKECLNYVKEARRGICQDTYVQNQIDGIEELFYSTIYKLENLQ